MHTPRYRRTFITLALVAAFGLTSALAACGNDKPDAAGSTSAAGGEKVSIAFIGESSSTDVIWSYRADCMRQEAERLGAEFVDRYAEGDFAMQAQMIEQEVARGVDAIIAPFFDPTASNQAIAKALDAGVAVYALLGVPDLPEDQLAKVSVVDLSWAELGSELAGVSLPELSDGDTVLWPAEAPDGTYITDAVAGFQEVATAEGKTIEVSVLDASSDPTTAASRILSYLTANPDTGAVVTSGAIAIGAANTAMTQGALAAGQPPLYGQVVSPVTTKGVRDGYMPAGVNLELTESSYQAVRDVVAIVRDGADPVRGTVPLVVVTKDNIESTVPEALR